MKLTSRPAKQWVELLLSPRQAACPSAGRFVFFSHFFATTFEQLFFKSLRRDNDIASTVFYVRTR